MMGADLVHGAASYCCFGTVPSLGGYVVEAVVLNKEPDGPPAPEYVIDFAGAGELG